MAIRVWLNLKKYAPLFCLAIVIMLSILLPNSPKHPKFDKLYFTYTLIGVFIIYSILLLIPRLRKFFDYNGPLIAGAIILLGTVDLMTTKLAILPVLHFPSPNNIIAVFFKDSELLRKCLMYSTRLLLWGYLFGAISGILTGILIGFSKVANYWISPLVRMLGPMPPVIWIPIALIMLPSAVWASTFLIALAVWFPTAIMTSSGISNIRQIYFDVGETLGATGIKKIIYIGIPSAMPHIFLGMFSGMCASFITLVTAEMIGAKYGIGWYINLNREMLSYPKVYAGILIIIVLFSIIIKMLFVLRNKLLVWQKGYIKW